MKRTLTTLLLLLCAVPVLFAQSRAKLLKKAQAGDVLAQYRLGCCYHRGQLDWDGDWDVVPRDYDAAEKWYLRAVAQGDDDACYMLGQIYRYVKNDRHEAIQWYKRAADYNYARNGEVSSIIIEDLKKLGVDYDPSTTRSSNDVKNISETRAELLKKA